LLRIKPFLQLAQTLYSLHALVCRKDGSHIHLNFLHDAGKFSRFTSNVVDASQPTGSDIISYMKTTGTSGKYVDGFVFAVPKKNVAAYKKMAQEAKLVWKKFGALDYKECMGNDLKPKASGGMPAPLSFTALAKGKPSETIWFSYIEYRSKAHRDLVNKKVMAYFSKKYAGKEDMSMPFDVKRMAYGGFSVEVG
jgi:uncharacterized protein YbaA (DUF1428 family)